MKILKNGSLYVQNTDLRYIRFLEGNNVNIRNLSSYYNNDSKMVSDFLLVEGQDKNVITSLDYIIDFNDCITLSNEEIDKEIGSYYDDIERVTNTNNYDNLNESDLEIIKYSFIIKQLKDIKSVKKGKSKIIFPDFIQDSLAKVPESRIKKLIKSLPRIR